MSVAENRLLLRLRQTTFRRMLQQDIAFHDEREVGELTSRLNSDCEVVATGISANFNIFLRNAVQLIFGLCYLATTSWRLSALLIGVWAILFHVYNVYGRFARRASLLRQDALAGLNTVATEALQNVRTVRSLAAEDTVLDQYFNSSKNFIFLEHQRAAAYGLYAAFYNGLSEGIKAVALGAGGVLIVRGSITAEQMTASMLYVDSVVGSSLAVGGQYRQLMQAIGSSRRVFEYAEMKPSPSVVDTKQSGVRIPDSELRGAITFRNVSFAYPTRPNERVLQGLDLRIEPGRTTAIVGTSGSGKSTIAALLQRWYEPDLGEVLLDETPLKDLDPRWLRSLLGVVTQDPRLFTATVRENIAMGLSETGPLNSTLQGGVADEEELSRLVQEAAAIAHADDFIKGLPEGYETPVGDVRLSGGQRQRIALARALARQPKVLVLDEATSALDRQTEAAVQASLLAYQRRRSATCVVIAHRLSTIVDVDEIVVLDGGRVVERGNHHQLLRKRGLYSRLVRVGGHMV